MRGQSKLFRLAYIPMLLLTLAAFGQMHTVAMTVDDLPLASGMERQLAPGDLKEVERVNKTILRVFARHKIPATGFVIEQQDEELGLSAASRVLQRWTDPGFDLGNHFYAHGDVDHLSLTELRPRSRGARRPLHRCLRAFHASPAICAFPTIIPATRGKSTTRLLLL